MTDVSFFSFLSSLSLRPLISFMYAVPTYYSYSLKLNRRTGDQTGSSHSDLALERRAPSNTLSTSTTLAFTLLSSTPPLSARTTPYSLPPSSENLNRLSQNLTSLRSRRSARSPVERTAPSSTSSLVAMGGKKGGRKRRSRSSLMTLFLVVSRLIPCASRGEGGASCDLEEERRRGTVVRRERAVAGASSNRKNGQIK